MPNEVLIKSGNCISYADHAASPGFSPTESLESGTPTNGQISLASVANAAARQSAKVDWGATRAAAYSCDALFEFAATPTAGNTVDIYLATSPSSTADSANPGNASGSDAAYTGDGTGSIAESVRQMLKVGSFVCTARATANLQVAHVGIVYVPQRYNCLVVVNNSGASFHSDDNEIHIVFTPIIDEIQ